nr:hypothetical protein [Alloiococcus otitis]
MSFAYQKKSFKKFGFLCRIKDITRNGKRTTKIVETLGNHEEIKQKHPEMDPEEWAKHEPPN